MSQRPSYVVRQDAGGELKLLLIRDPRATHVAAKISPVKRTPSSQSAPAAASPSSSAQTSSGLADQQPTKSPRKVNTVVPEASSLSGGVSALSPTSLTQAANEAMALATLVKMSATQDSGTATQAAGKKGDGGRAKGGRIIKPQRNKMSPVVVPKSPLKSAPLPHATAPLSHSSAKPQPPRVPLSNPKPASKGAVATPKHQPLLPVSRIRTIMRTNVQSTHSTHNVSQDSVALVTKATELFIAQLAKEAHKVSMAAATRDVSYNHLATSIRKVERTTFLHDVIPEKVLVRDYLASLDNNPDHTHNVSTSSTSH